MSRWPRPCVLQGGHANLLWWPFACRCRLLSACCRGDLHHILPLACVPSCSAPPVAGPGGGGSSGGAPVGAQPPHPGRAGCPHLRLPFAGARAQRQPGGHPLVAAGAAPHRGAWVAGWGERRAAGAAARPAAGTERQVSGVAGGRARQGARRRRQLARPNSLPHSNCTLQVLRHDDVGAETLLNLLLRNYLHYNLYDQARPGRAAERRRGEGVGLRVSRGGVTCGEGVLVGPGRWRRAGSSAGQQGDRSSPARPRQRGACAVLTRAPPPPSIWPTWPAGRAPPCQSASPRGLALHAAGLPLPVLPGTHPRRAGVGVWPEAVPGTGGRGRPRQRRDGKRRSRAVVRVEGPACFRPTAIHVLNNTLHLASQTALCFPHRSLSTLRPRIACSRRHARWALGGLWGAESGRGWDARAAGGAQRGQLRKDGTCGGGVQRGSKQGQLRGCSASPPAHGAACVRCRPPPAGALLCCGLPRGGGQVAGEAGDVAC